MVAKQFGQKDKRSATQQHQEANLGQKEAGQEKKKKSDLSNMGKTSRTSSAEPNKRRSD
jgi:hypothetical protein